MRRGGRGGSGDEAVRERAKPRVGAPVLIDKAGRRARETALEVPVRYPAVRAGKLGQPARADAEIDAGGRRIEPVPEPDARSGIRPREAATRRHHFFLRKGDAEAVRSAIRAGKPVRVTVRAQRATEETGEPVTATRRTDLGAEDLRVASRPAKEDTTGDGSRASLGESEVTGGTGNNPCDEIDFVPCLNAKGTVWLAEGFLHSNAQTVACPQGYLLATEMDDNQSLDNYWEIETKSKKYTDTSFPVASDRLKILMTDDNLRGHPIHYTPYVACTPKGKTQAASGSASNSRSLGLTVLNKTGSDVSIDLAAVRSGTTTSQTPTAPVVLQDQETFVWKTKGAQHCRPNCLAAGIFVNPPGGDPPTDATAAQGLLSQVIEYPFGVLKKAPPDAAAFFAINPEGWLSESCWTQGASSGYVIEETGASGAFARDFDEEWVIRKGTPNGKSYNGCTG